VFVPLSWLRDFAPFSIEGRRLGAVFDDLGMVVEDLRAVGEGLDGVVVARIVDIASIEGADKIRRVVVDAGGDAPVQVVCGAWNFAVGDLVPLAPVGTVLPGDFVITQRKMKGVVSDGMLCSASELGLGDDAAGILVLDPKSGPVGRALRDALGLESDVVYDLAIEANRPDAMCVAGVARDAAARLSLPFAIEEPPALSAHESVAACSVEVQAPDLCPRFTAMVLEGVTVTDSPDWVARRLTLAGMRPINSVVDASNYVMLELGQPTHPYDLEQLPGQGFTVRAARPGEKLETLDGVERVLGDGAFPDCLICDALGQPVGIAGIMGGSSSEISASTTKVVLEAANFTPMAIARTSKRIGLRSEASARFERGVDLEGIERAVRRFVEIVALTAPGLLTGPLNDERSPAAVSGPPIRLRTSRVNAVLGTALTDDEIRRYLAPIGFAAVPVAAGEHEVTVPSFRPDATREIDLVEEVARHHGYSNVTRTVPHSPAVGRLTPYQSARRFVREVLAGAGLSEAVCAQLVGPGDHARSGLAEDGIMAVDPLVREESVLRTSLLPGLLRAVAFNSDRRNGDLGMFEIGHVFSRPSDLDAVLPDERERLGIVLAGTGVAAVGQGAPGVVVACRRLADALRLASFELVASSAAGLHPGRTASVRVDGAAIGSVGEVDPEVSAAWGIEGRVGWGELDLTALLGAGRRSELAAPVSRYPSTDIDLAFVVADEVPAADVASTLEAVAGPTLERLELFDVYRGQGVPDGSRSLAYRLRLCALDHTLTEAEIAATRTAAVQAVAEAHKGRLRS